MNVLDILTGLVLGWLSCGVGWWLARSLIQRWCLRRFGQPLDLDALIVRYSRQMTTVHDRPTLGKLLTEELILDLHLDRAALLLPANHRFEDVSSGGIQLPMSHAAVRWVASGGEAQSVRHGRLRAIIDEGRQDLAWTGTWVPLMYGTELRGLLLFGHRRNGLDFAPEALMRLTGLGRQAAIVLEIIQSADRDKQAASEIRALYHRVVAAHEVERNRLARDLHDGVLQDLCSVSRDLKSLDAQHPGSERRYTDLAIRSGEAIQALRAVCNDLRPPLLQRDLATALKALIDQLVARAQPSTHITLHAAEVHLPDDAALAFFRIAQEALHNAIRHADASEIEVRLTAYPDHMRLTITDDGCGIAEDLNHGRLVAHGHFGIAGMRERAAMIDGHLDVLSAPDYGTVVVLEVPR